jgi:uncharacterized membrane protein YbhN (UPF0104 family)
MKVSLPDVLRRTHLEHGRRTLAAFVLGAAALSLAAVVGIGLTLGYEAIWDRLMSIEPQWFAVAFGAQALAYIGYIAAYREVARVDEGPSIPAADAAALVSTGFGAFLLQGGFAVDLHAFRQECIDDRDARVRVLGLGALEYALLAPAACAASILLLTQGVHHPNAGITLPWAIAVPLGFVAAVWALGHRARFTGHTGWRDLIAQALDSLHVLRLLLVRVRHLAAPLGTAVYWFGDILCLWACLHAFEGSAPGIAQLVVGYATGYAATRRALPLGGAGVVEALLPYALGWLAIGLAPALVAVFVYRVINLWLPMIPAIAGIPTLRRLERARPGSRRRPSQQPG